MNGMTRTLAVAGAIILVLFPLALYFNDPNTELTDKAAASPTPTQTESPMALATDPADARTATQVVLSTSKGDLILDLYPDKAPRTVKNFVTLGTRGYYNGVIFHRIIPSFMVQGGDPTGTGRAGESIYGAKFEDEIWDGQKVQKFSLAMANAGPNTNGSQFFIVTTMAQPHLDTKHTVFGELNAESAAALAAIEAVGSQNGTPSEVVTISGFKVTKD